MVVRVGDALGEGSISSSLRTTNTSASLRTSVRAVLFPRGLSWLTSSRPDDGALQTPLLQCAFEPRLWFPQARPLIPSLPPFTPWPPVPNPRQVPQAEQAHAHHRQRRTSLAPRFSVVQRGGWGESVPLSGGSPGRPPARPASSRVVERTNVPLAPPPLLSLQSSPCSSLHPSCLRASQAVGGTGGADEKKRNPSLTLLPQRYPHLLALLQMQIGASPPSSSSSSPRHLHTHTHTHAASSSAQSEASSTLNSERRSSFPREEALERGRLARGAVPGRASTKRSRAYSPEGGQVLQVQSERERAGSCFTCTS